MLPGLAQLWQSLRDNLAWMAAAIVFITFIALVLTAMQLGLATDRLHGDASRRRTASPSSILRPMCTLGLKSLFNLV